MTKKCLDSATHCSSYCIWCSVYSSYS